MKVWREQCSSRNFTNDASEGRTPGIVNHYAYFSMMGPPAAVEPKPELPLNGRADESADNLAKMTEALLDEFLNVCDYNEAYQCISEKFHSGNLVNQNEFAISLPLSLYISLSLCLSL